MSVLIVDDHLLGDIIGDMIPPRLALLLRDDGVATTNLYYLRLCRATLAGRGGALTASWSAERRQQAAQALIALSPDIEIMPMQSIAFRMAELARNYRLSSLGAEAVAATEARGGSLCVWDGDDGPNIRSCCGTLGVGYNAIAREKPPQR